MAITDQQINRDLQLSRQSVLEHWPTAAVDCVKAAECEHSDWRAAWRWAGEHGAGYYAAPLDIAAAIPPGRPIPAAAYGETLYELCGRITEIKDASDPCRSALYTLAALLAGVDGVTLSLGDGTGIAVAGNNDLTITVTCGPREADDGRVWFFEAPGVPLAPIGAVVDAVNAIKGRVLTPPDD